MQSRWDYLKQNLYLYNFGFRGEPRRMLKVFKRFDKQCSCRFQGDYVLGLYKPGITWLYVHNNLFWFLKLFIEEVWSLSLRTTLGLLVMSVCDLFNDVFSRSDYTALNYRMINE
jgi:hypothetical protein